MGAIVDLVCDHEGDTGITEVVLLDKHHVSSRAELRDGARARQRIRGVNMDGDPSRASIAQRVHVVPSPALSALSLVQQSLPAKTARGRFPPTERGLNGASFGRPTCLYGQEFCPTP